MAVEKVDNDAASAYLRQVCSLIDQAAASQATVIEAAAEIAAKAINDGHLLYVFGATHGGILAQELFYRAGGLVPICPILPPGLTTDVRPITLTSQIERMSGYARLILDGLPMESGDILIVISVSGRNTVAIEMAELARAMGVKVIAVTSVAYSLSVQSRAPSGRRLCESADLILDLGGEAGDATIHLPGFSQAIAPTSTVVGAALLNAWVARTAQKIQEQGLEPPVFMSANLDGGDDHNQRLLSRYRGRLNYL